MEVTEILLALVNDFVNHPDISAELSKVTSKDGKYVLINNSFMFREGVSTKKNAKYLAFSLDTIPVTTDSCFIIEGFELRNDFKIVQKTDDKIKLVKTIEEAVSVEIQKLGDIVFILMGEIDNSVELSFPIEDTTYQQLVFNPRASKPVILESNRIVCQSIDDEGALWSEIERLLMANSATSIEIEDLKTRLGTPIVKLREQVYLNLIIPTQFNTDKKYFLELISDSIRQQLDIYRNSLENLNAAGFDRTDAMNEILRISYNFVEASDTVLRLIISVCDLKPLLLWLTFMTHRELTEAIKVLPWKKQDTKASMKMYANTVKKARNKTFHSLIPFTKSFNVKLPENSIKDANLRIFSEFGTKSNRLEYKDKELVDALMVFTRTSEEIVANDFWEKNVSVIEQTCAVIDATAQALRKLKERI